VVRERLLVRCVERVPLVGVPVRANLDPRDRWDLGLSVQLDHHPAEAAHRLVAALAVEALGAAVEVDGRVLEVHPLAHGHSAHLELGAGLRQPEQLPADAAAAEIRVDIAVAQEAAAPGVEVCISDDAAVELDDR
jgi:hypothetical protein